MHAERAPAPAPPHVMIYILDGSPVTFAITMHGRKHGRKHGRTNRTAHNQHKKKSKGQNDRLKSNDSFYSQIKLKIYFVVFFLLYRNSCAAENEIRTNTIQSSHYRIVVGSLQRQRHFQASLH